MSAPSSQSDPTGALSKHAPVSGAEIEASCRLPLLLMFVSAAVWLVIGSVFALIASVKFHQPAFLADWSWLTYGRVRPAYYNSLVYGFCIQAGLGVGIWILTHLGGDRLTGRWMITVGAKLWNLGLTIGIIGILAGDSTGYPLLEIPAYSALFLFVGYATISAFALLTFRRRRNTELFISHWFLVAALFWFPWIYSTGYLLIAVFPVRGVAQAAIAWWYSANVETLWLGLVGLAAAFYLVPKLKQRELKSDYLALLTFWTLLLFGGWTGIPRSAPLPAWMSALSASAAIVLLIAILTVGLNLYGTMESLWPEKGSTDVFRFICVGITGFILAELLTLLGLLPGVSAVTDLTWYTVAREHMILYGFFAMLMFGGIYYILPRLTGVEFSSARLIRVHFVLAFVGIALIVLPLTVGGILEGVSLGRPNIGFLQISKASLLWLRISTLGDFSLFIGHLIFLVNLVGVVRRFSHTRFMAAYSTMTQDVTPAEAGV